LLACHLLSSFLDCVFAFEGSWNLTIQELK
jgi:hypothetical protein